MTMTAVEPTALVGFLAFDADGEKLGEIEGVYLGTENPEWAAVLLDERFVIIPLHEAQIYEDSLDVPFTLEEISGAPLQQDDLLEDLTEEQEDLLVTYYSSAGTVTGTAVATTALDTGDEDDAGSAGVREAGAEVATAAKEQGQEVAAAAKEHGQQVASAAKEETRRVASTAKQQTQQVASTAKEQATEVVGTAKQQASEVAQQASAQARNLLEETRTRLEDQTAEGAHKLGDNLSRLGTEALALAEGRPDEAPTLRGYAQRSGESLLDAADRAYGLSDDVRTRGIGSVLADVQTFARRRPGVFLLGTAVVGVLAGRAVRNAQGEDDDQQPVAALPPAGNGRRSAGTARRPSGVAGTGTRGGR